MNGIIAFIEKGRPFFDKLSSNIYLQSIRDGFLNAMPAILFSVSLSSAPRSRMYSALRFPQRFLPGCGVSTTCPWVLSAFS